MVSYYSNEQECTELLENVQFEHLFSNCKSLLKDRLVLPQYLVRFEEQLLVRQRITHPTTMVVSPVAFLLETERNVFLWRHGLSLTAAAQFDFWVDLPRLISKRIAQLESFSPGNPFCGPFALSYSDDSRHDETDYWLELLDNFDIAGPHLSALSVTAHLLHKTLTKAELEEPIILPYYFKQH